MSKEKGPKMVRKPLSKAVRFEVFKRDKFTCQYCGSKAPEVVLNVDHIEPVSKGGNNEVINLITSCFGCNSGKKDKKLDDTSVIDKQRKQLEYMQEKREQMELIFEWKKSLDKLEEDEIEKVKEYVNAKINPYTISEHGLQQIKKHLKKYGTSNILEAIDISTSRYLVRANSGELTKFSVNEFIDKIGGIAFNRSLAPVDQKISMLKQLAKSHLKDCTPGVMSIVLNNYVNLLRQYLGYTDQQIVDDLNGDVRLIVKSCWDWSEFEKTIVDRIAKIKSVN